MRNEELLGILAKHNLWLNEEESGSRANLSRANLSGVDLSRANLSGANLSRANLSGANLSEVDLSGANLSRANLSRANLSGVDLRWANLSRANLSGVDLSGANLSEVDLSGVDLSRAKGYYSFVAYDTSKRIVHCIRYEDTWKVQAGCFWGTLEELEKKVKETHNSEVYLTNIKLLRNMK